MTSARRLLLNPRTLGLSFVCLAVPSAFYVQLVDKRLKRRLPLVLRDELPVELAEPPRFGIHPRINYVEGWYADVPKKWFCDRPKVEEFARAFWLQNKLLDFEAGLFAWLAMVGIRPYELRGERNCKNKVVEGKELVQSIFHVERANEDRVDASYWFAQPGPLLGGVHTLAVDATPQQDKRFVRVWFVSHFALNLPTDRVVAVKQGDGDARLPEAEKGYFPALLWFHRLYARYLLDWTLGVMMRNCKEEEEISGGR